MFSAVAHVHVIAIPQWVGLTITVTIVAVVIIVVLAFLKRF